MSRLHLRHTAVGMIAVALIALSLGRTPIAAASSPPLGLGQTQLKTLIKYFDAYPARDFKDFLARVAEVDNTPDLAAAIEKFQQDVANRQPHVCGSPRLSSDECKALYRLLGVYARTRYAKDIKRQLGEWVALDTSERPDHPTQYDNPTIIRMGKMIGATADTFGLEFVNYDNRVFEVFLPGADAEAESFGIYTHSDVVPADEKNWTGVTGIEPGKPFLMQEADGRLYGRGTQDDKASIVAAMYAMKAIKESGLQPLRKIRLFIETTEETGGEGIQYYRDHHKDLPRAGLPPFNVVLDSGYPVVTAEKGVGSVSAYFPLHPPAPGDAAYVSNITGGTAINQVPATSEITIQAADPKPFYQSLQSVQQDFLKQYNDKPTPSASPLCARQLTRHDFVNAAEKRAYEQVRTGHFEIELPTAPSPTLKITITGVSAHSSEPQEGLNPLPPALLLVAMLHHKQLIAANHFTDAAALIEAKSGMDFYGSKLGVFYADEGDEQPLTGCLTLAITYSAQATDPMTGADVWVIGGNVRNPRDPRPILATDDTTAPLRPLGHPDTHQHNLATNRLENRILHSLDEITPRFKREVTYLTDIEYPMYRDPKQPRITTLGAIFCEVTGAEKCDPISSAGTTTAKQLPHGVSFGPAFPGEKYHGHTANEYKRIDHFQQDVQLFTEMILRIGSLKELTSRAN